MKTLFIGTAIAVSAVTGAAAQELSYGHLFANYGMWSTPGGDANVTALGAEVGVRVQDFDFWIDGVQVTVAPDGAPSNLTANVFTIGAGYTFAGTYRVDVSSTDLGFGFGGPGFNIGLDEIGIAYDNGTFFGRLSYADINQPGLGVDGLIGLHVGYQFNDYADVSMSVHALDEASGTVDPLYILSGEYDTGQWGVKVEYASVNFGGTDLSLIGLAGNYRINDQWGVRGAYTTVDLGGLDANLIRIGGTYNVNDAYSLYAGLSRADLGGTEVDGFNFGMTMDFGDKPDSYETTADRLFSVVETAGAFDF